MNQTTLKKFEFTKKKKLSPDEYSEDRKLAMVEIEQKKKRGF